MPLPNDSDLSKAVAKATTALVNRFVDGQLDSVVENVLIPLEGEIMKTINDQVGGDNEMKLAVMEKTLGEHGEGTLAEGITVLATAQVSKIKTVLEEGLESILRGDVSGSPDGTKARIGRFEAFVEILLGNARAALEKKMKVLLERVAEVCQESVCKLASPTYNLKSRSGRIVVDAKAVADSVLRSILSVAARPLVDGEMVAASVGACTVWDESCAKEREKLEKELARISGVLELELFQRYQLTIVDWDAVETVVGEEKANKMKQGEGNTGTLDICRKKITDDGCRILAPALMKMTRLTRLDLDHNQIGKNGVQYLVPALMKMTKLEKLYLHRNQIGNDGIATLCNVLPQMKALKELRLFSNQIGDVGCHFFIDLLKNGTFPSSLNELHLSRNSIFSNKTKKEFRKEWEKTQGKNTGNLYL